MFAKFGIEREEPKFVIEQVFPLKYPSLQCLAMVNVETNKYLLTSSGSNLVILDLRTGAVDNLYSYSINDNVT